MAISITRRRPTSAAVAVGDAVRSDSAAVAAWTMVSRATGLVRVVVVAGVLGPTFFGNLFQFSNTLPNLVYEMTVGSLLASLLVPSLVAAIDAGGHDTASRLARNVLGLLTVAAVALGMVLVAIGPWLAGWFGSGIDDASTRADFVDVGRPLLLLLVPQAALYVVAGVAAAVQNAHGSFRLPAAASIVENLVIVAVFATFWGIHGAGVEADTLTGSKLVLLAGGATLAVGSHAALQWWGAWRLGHPLVPIFGWRAPEVRHLVGLARVSAPYAIASALRYAMVLAAAATVEGGTVVMLVAISFVNVPTALIAKSSATASLPRLSRLRQDGDLGGFVELHGSVLHRSLRLLVLAAAALVALGRPMSEVFTFGAMATPDGQHLVAVTLSAIALAVVGDGLFWSAANAAYALGRVRLPAEAMVVRVAALAVGAAVAVRADGVTTMVVLALGVAASDLLAGVLLHRRVLAALTGRGVRASAGPITRIAASGLIAAVVGVATAGALHPGPSAPVTQRLLALAITGATVLVTHVVSWELLTRRVAERVASPAAIELAAGMGVAGAVGVAATQLGYVVPTAVVAVTLCAAVASRPSLGSYLWFGVSPLVVGAERGTVVPFLRLNEALLALIVLGVGARALFRPVARVRLTSGDLAVVALVMAGALVPIVERYRSTGAVTFDELLNVAPLIKLGIVYAVVRVTIRTAGQVRRAFVVALSAASVVAVVGFLQAVDAPGVRSFLASTVFASATDTRSISSGRGTSTIGSSIGASGFYVVALLVALAWIERSGGPRRFLTGVIAVLLLGTAGTAQFSAMIALAVGVGALVIDRRRGGRVQVAQSSVPPDVSGVRRMMPVRLLVAVPLLLAGAVVFAPRMSGLMAGDLPQSWEERWHNLSTHFLPLLGIDRSLISGVSPITQVRDPRGYVEWIWIESGYVWLLWVGGIWLLAAFVLLTVVHVRAAATIVRSEDEFGVAAASTRTAFAVMVVLMVLDPHLTMRGTGDVFFPLIALGATGAALAARSAHDQRRVQHAILVLREARHV